MRGNDDFTHVPAVYHSVDIIGPTSHLAAYDCNTANLLNLAIMVAIFPSGDNGGLILDISHQRNQPVIIYSRKS